MKKTNKKLVRTTIMISAVFLGAVGIIGYETYKNLTNNQVQQSGQSEIATQLAKKNGTKLIEFVPLGQKGTKKIAKPIIHTKDITIQKGEEFNVLDSTSADDAYGNDLTNKIKTEGSVDSNTPGTYTLGLAVSDSDGNKVTAEKKVTVEDAIVEDNSETTLPSSENIPANSSTEHATVSSAPTSTSKTETPAVNELAQTTTTTQQAPVIPEVVETQPAPTTPAYSASTMYVAGQAISYQNGGQAYGQSIIDSYPDTMISTWGGAATQSGADGQNTHFIGHNPGVFSVVFNLSTGNQIIVTDSNGTSTTYTVSSIFQVDHYANGIDDGVNYWDTITGTGGGERVTLQACVNDTVNIIIIANA